MSRWHPKVVSLFSGIGGMDLGFKKAGMKIMAQVDNDPFCVETLRTNKISRAVMQIDVFKTKGSDILDEAGLTKDAIDLIVGGPSCQPFSRSNEGKRRGIDDPRGRLVLEFVRIVKEIHPVAFVMENVVGLASSNNGKDLEIVLKGLTKCGYRVTTFVLNAADFGVPQKRQRLFIIGFCSRKLFLPPEPTHAEEEKLSNGLKPYVSSGEALYDLDDAVNHDGAVTIGGKYGHLLNEIPPGMNYLFYTKKMKHPRPRFKWRSKFWPFLLKLDPTKPSNTIQATPGPYVGPFHWRNRRLTIQEIKRLQTIPDSWFISGYRRPEYTSPAWKQVGNAVPPVMAEAIGREIISALG